MRFFCHPDSSGSYRMGFFCYPDSSGTCRLGFFCYPDSSGSYRLRFFCYPDSFGTCPMRIFCYPDSSATCPMRIFGSPARPATHCVRPLRCLPQQAVHVGRNRSRRFRRMCAIRSMTSDLKDMRPNPLCGFRPTRATRASSPNKQLTPGSSRPETAQQSGANIDEFLRSAQVAHAGRNRRRRFRRMCSTRSLTSDLKDIRRNPLCGFRPTRAKGFIGEESRVGIYTEIVPDTFLALSLIRPRAKIQCDSLN